MSLTSLITISITILTFECSSFLIMNDHLILDQVEVIIIFCNMCFIANNLNNTLG